MMKSLSSIILGVSLGLNYLMPSYSIEKEKVVFPSIKKLVVIKQKDNYSKLEEILVKDKKIKVANITKKEIASYFRNKHFKKHLNIKKYFLFNPEKESFNKVKAAKTNLERKKLEKLVFIKYKKTIGLNSKIIDGKKFVNKYITHLKRAEKKYGVSKKLIAATIGIETNYGKVKGGYRIFNALTSIYSYVDIKGKTNWKKFALSNLKELLIYAKKQNKKYDVPIAKILFSHSSYAGCSSAGQFTPKSLNNYYVGVNGEKDGQIDNIIDSIYSVANYHKNMGWEEKHNEIFKEKNTLLETKIIKIIKKYNNSSVYAKATLEIAKNLD